MYVPFAVKEPSGSSRERGLPARGGPKAREMAICRRPAVVHAGKMPALPGKPLHAGPLSSRGGVVRPWAFVRPPVSGRGRCPGSRASCPRNRGRDALDPGVALQMGRTPRSRRLIAARARFCYRALPSGGRWAAPSSRSRCRASSSSRAVSSRHSARGSPPHLSLQSSRPGDFASPWSSWIPTSTSTPGP